MEFDSIYEKLISFEGIERKERHIECHNLQIDKNHRQCLFCGKSFPQVKFSRIAHAVSESLGNKNLINFFECDECNLTFGRVLEDSFGKYIMPYKFISGVYGKKNSLTIKDTALNEFRMERRKESGALVDNKPFPNYIMEKKGLGICEIIENGFRLNIPRQHYNPRLVYAALLKMGYSILPLDEIKQCMIGIACLKAYVYQEDPFDNPEEAEKYICSLPNKGVLLFYPGINPLKGTNVYMYRRKKGESNKYSKFLFQIDLKNFSLVVPILADSDEEAKKMCYPVLGEEHFCQIIDFEKEEKKYSCEFTAEKQMISLDEYRMIEEQFFQQNNS